MNSLLKKVCVAIVLATIPLMFLSGAIVGLVGCSKKNDATPNSPYSVDYKLVDGGQSVSVEATIKGPAAKLAVILTSPSGKATIKVIEKEDMLSNCLVINVPIDDPQAGTYVLKLKTVDPEKVVCQKEITLSSNKWTVEDVLINFGPNVERTGEVRGSRIEGVQVVLQKAGDLPVTFTNASVMIGSKKSFATRIISNSIKDEKQTVSISVFFPVSETEAEHAGFGFVPRMAFLAGDKHIVKGTLFFGKDNQSLDFEKEFVVPPDLPRGF